MFKELIRKRLFKVIMFVLVIAIPTGVVFAQYLQMYLRYAPIAYGEIRTANAYWVDNGTWCPTDRGTEYVFRYTFSSPVTNPAAIVSNSANVAVDSAIAYYTGAYGGMRLWYDTTSPTVYTCVGNKALTAVGLGSIANGAALWASKARLIR